MACPGRLFDLMGQRAVDLRSVEILVLDEADQMFDMGFLPSIRRILAALPTPRQTLLFSATMPDEIRSLANEFLRRPVTIELGASRPVDTVGHAIYPVDQTRKLSCCWQSCDSQATARCWSLPAPNTAPRSWPTN